MAKYADKVIHLMLLFNYHIGNIQLHHTNNYLVRVHVSLYILYWLHLSLPGKTKT